MIPVLYASTETVFTSNGLGKLADATTCRVTEERNGQYELEMEYPITGVHFSDIAISSLIKAVPADGKAAQLFRIYKITKPKNGIVTINAEHISYQLSHIPVSPFTAASVTAALLGLKQNAAETCPFEFWTDKSTAAAFSVKEPSSIRSLLGGVAGSILDVYGGEYEFDNYTVKLHQNRGTDRGVTLRYGKNITDIRQEINIASTYTGVMPYWKGTNSSQQEYVVTLTEKVLHSANASNFPYQRTIPLDLSSEFESEPTQAQLRARAQSYMTANNIGIPSVSIDVSFVALWQTEEYKDIANLERVNLCDTVIVEFPKLDISASAKVVKTVYNVLKDRYDSIELGEARTSLAQSIRSDITNSIPALPTDIVKKSFLQAELDAATQLITGGLGGYVVFNHDANGKPQEILIMDTDDIETAVNVIRFNRNGIGFSTNGYDGPFTSAWTIDGHFVADFITTGTLSANLIRGGVLALGGLNNGRGVLQLVDSSGNVIGTFDNSGINLTGEMEIVNGNAHFYLGSGCLPQYRIIEGLATYNIHGAFTKLYYNNQLWGISCDHVDKIGQGMNHYEEVKATKCAKFAKVIAVNATANAMENNNTYGGAPFLLIEYDGSRLDISSNADTDQGGSFWTTSLYRDHLPQYASSSSEKYKHDISDIINEELSPHRLLNLRIVQFIYNKDHPLQYDDMDGKTLPGFIAEDVAEIYPAAVIHDDEGNIKSWDERRIIPGMLALIQEQDKKIKDLENRLSRLEDLLL